MAAAESLASFFIPTSDEACKIDLSTLDGSIPEYFNNFARISLTNLISLAKL